MGAARGTAIVVGRLFEDYPARRKFLRSTATENSRIHTVVGRYALAYPHVRFTLDTGTSSSFATPGSGGARLAPGYRVGAASGRRRYLKVPWPWPNRASMWRSAAARGRPWTRRWCGCPPCR